MVRGRNTWACFWQRAARRRFDAVARFAVQDVVDAADRVSANGAVNSYSRMKPVGGYFLFVGGARRRQMALPQALGRRFPPELMGSSLSMR